ncbi:MAG TPA: hypothetical protein VK177_15785 [Flavobacteriales bacterium]|nr:hypothetical protein [Flavobacteriales bacterium]
MKSILSVLLICFCFLVAAQSKPDANLLTGKWSVLKGTYKENIRPKMADKAKTANEKDPFQAKHEWLNLNSDMTYETADSKGKWKLESETDERNGNVSWFAVLDDVRYLILVKDGYLKQRIMLIREVEYTKRSMWTLQKQE